jgi:hypothetical protein
MKPFQQNLGKDLDSWVSLVLIFAVWSPKARADLHFPQPSAGVGEVRTGKPLIHRFNFINTGPDMVEIIDTRADCGCMTPRLEKRVFQPAEQGTLVLEINTLSQSSGPHTWRVHVGYRAGNRQGEAALQLTAQVVTEISVRPAALTIFTGSATNYDILVTDVRPHPLAIREVRTSSPKLTGRVAGDERNAGGQVVRKVRVELAGDCPDGRHAVRVTIFTDDPGYPELTVPVTIVKQARQRIAASPSQVTFLTSPGQAVPARIVLVRDRDNQEVVVDKVETDHPAVICQWAQGPGTMATVKVRVDPTRLHEESLHTLFQVHVRKPVPETVLIPVTCTRR